ncbi:MAG: serine/threonine protein kinase/formylglycine-generating enzyme required for sulfatase activity [Myxococcota bacterium]|jgi:serine/threonine protein kinase/formylglycine-generating enzyme required for sulfatase activity
MAGSDDTWQAADRSWYQAARPAEQGTLAGPPAAAAPVPVTAILHLERYEDLGSIGMGGMGEVRRVRDRKLDRILAMKIISLRGMSEPGLVARFLEEARATAALQHPGIVPVHDSGALPDGRLWFTMKEVRGQTFREVMATVHRLSRGRWQETADGWSLRRLIDALRRVCEAVGYAHARGILHRDLKPDNIMVGEHGEVLVLDWGLVRDDTHRERLLIPEAHEPVGTAMETRHGAVMGTPHYMPPEQAAGRIGEHGPHSDVFSLGAVLFEILTGAPPMTGTTMQVWQAAAEGAVPRADSVVSAQHPPLPGELVEICAQATAREPQQRHPDATRLGADLAAWLDGARREAEARQMLARAQLLRPEIADARDAARQHRASAARILSDLAPYSPVSQKSVAWAEEDAAATLEAQAILKETTWLQAVRAALEVASQLPALHEALAEHYAERLHDAELNRQPDQATRAEIFLRSHDRGRFAHVLSGLGAVTLVTDPSGATVTAWRFVEQQRRLVPVRDRVLGQTPLIEAPLPFGSWLLTIEHPGCETVRYPVSITRGEHWHGVAPGESAPHAIHLPPVGSLAADDCYVPAGWFWSGGDPDAADGLPLRRLWVDGLVVKRVPVTVGQYLMFLNDVAEREGVEAALKQAPQARATVTGGDGLAGITFIDGEFQLAPGVGGEHWTAENPITLIDWHNMMAYTQWYTGRAGESWRLPNELEWEKGARGVDGRRLVWGETLEPTWANVLGHTRGNPAMSLVGTFPHDESVYGIRDLMGNVRDRCVNLWRFGGPSLDGARVIEDPAPPDDSTWRSVRGGGFLAVSNLTRPASRFADLPDKRFRIVGFRMIRMV